MKFLPQLPYLKVLNLEDSNVTDFDFLTALNLTHLNLEHTNIKDSELKYLIGHVDLKSLNLSCTEIRDLQPLTGLKLESLILRELEISDDGYGHLAMITSLKDLNLGHVKISNEQFARLAPLINLQCLYIEQEELEANEGITDEGIGFLRNFPKLQSLHLLACNVRGEGIAGLTVLVNEGELRDLKNLDFRGCSGLSVRQVVLLTLNLPNLESLALSVNDSEIDEFAGLPPRLNLKRLIFMQAEPLAGTIVGCLLEKFPNLEEISFEFSLLTHSVLGRLAGFKNLKKLNLEGSIEYIAEADFALLVNLENLKELNLSACFGVKDENLIPLALLPRLSVLNLSDCQNITDEVFTHLKMFPSLVDVKLDQCNGITAEGFVRFSEHQKTKIV